MEAFLIRKKRKGNSKGFLVQQYKKWGII